MTYCSLLRNKEITYFRIILQTGNKKLKEKIVEDVRKCRGAMSVSVQLQKRFMGVTC